MFGESSSSFAAKPPNACFEDISFYKRFRDNNPALVIHNRDDFYQNSPFFKRPKHQPQIIEQPNRHTEASQSQNRFYCETCDVFCNSPVDFQIHVSGKRHARACAVNGKNVSTVDFSSRKMATDAEFCIANGKDPNTMVKEANPDEPGVLDKRFYCPECSIQCSGAASWEAHCKGKKHAKKVQSSIAQSPSSLSAKNQMPRSAFDLNSLNIDGASRSKDDYVKSQMSKNPFDLNVLNMDSAGRHREDLGLRNNYGLKLDVFEDRQASNPQWQMFDRTKEEANVKLSPSANVEIEGHRKEDFYCKVCHVQSNSLKSYEAHLQGKKHVRACRGKQQTDNAPLDSATIRTKECFLLDNAQSNSSPLRTTCVFEKEKVHPGFANTNHPLMEFLKPHSGSHCCTQPAKSTALNCSKFGEENHALDVSTCLGLGVFQREGGPSKQQQDQDDENKVKQLLSSLITKNAPDCVISALRPVYDANSAQDACIRCYSCCNDDTKAAPIKMHTGCFLRLVKSLLLKRQL